MNIYSKLRDLKETHVDSLIKMNAATLIAHKIIYDIISE